MSLLVGSLVMSVQKGRSRCGVSVIVHAMAVQDLTLIRGMGDTRATLARWNTAPLPVLLRWSAASVAVALLLLAAVWLVGTLATSDPTPRTLIGLTSPPTLGDVAHVLT